MMVFRGAVAAVLAGLLALPSAAQDDEKPTFVPLPPIPAFKLPSENYLILHGKVAGPQAEFLRRLRQVPAAPSIGEPTSLIIERYLKKPSRAFATQDAYVESDWIGIEDLAIMAALVPKAALAVDELFGVPERQVMKSVIVKTREDYLALTDAWADEDRLKRQARSLTGIYVKGYRDSFEVTQSAAYSLVMADTIRRHLPDYIRTLPPLMEGIHTYLTVLAVGDFQTYVAIDTTPRARGWKKPTALYEFARQVLSRPTHENMDVLLRSELNSITFERLAVLFSLIDFLLQKDRSVWKKFVEALDRESHEGGKLKGPEGRYRALEIAFQEALGLDLKGLDLELSKFTSASYLFTEELARVVGLDRECSESTYQGFETVCRLKREGKPVSERGERIHAEILKRLEKKLEKEKY